LIDGYYIWEIQSVLLKYGEFEQYDCFLYSTEEVQRWASVIYVFCERVTVQLWPATYILQQ